MAMPVTMKPLLVYLATAICRWPLVFPGSGPAGILISALLALFDPSQTIHAARTATDAVILQLQAIDTERVLLTIGEASMPFDNAHANRLKQGEQ